MQSAASSEPSNSLVDGNRAREEKFIFIDENYIRLVVGSKKQNIRKIEHETSVLINIISFGPNELHHNIDALRAYEDAKRKWGNEEEMQSRKNDLFQLLHIFASTKEQIVLVELAIDALITDAKRRKKKLQMKISAESIGYVKGIRRLRSEYDVRCEISKEVDGTATILLEGTQEGIEGAKTRILEMVGGKPRPAFGEELW